MRHMTFTVLSATAAIVISACGSNKSPSVTTKSDSPTTSTQSSPAALEKAAREAISKDHALLINTLWTNRIPANPPATAGPALALLRRSVGERQKQGVRVRMLSDHFRVLSLQLEPTYTTATATVLDTPRVQPTHLNGQPLGSASSTSQRVRVELRRVGNTTSFVVWKTTLIK
jgi:hypothetical protein